MAPAPLGKGLGGGGRGPMATSVVNDDGNVDDNGGGIDGSGSIDGGIFCALLMVVLGLFHGCFQCSLGLFWWLFSVQFGCCFVAIFSAVWVLFWWLFLVQFGCCFVQ